MFSAKLSRVAHRATSAAILSSSTTSSCTASRAPQCISARPAHQRRPSSSKASCPPDSSPSGGKPAPAAKTTSASGEPSKAPIADPGLPRGSRKVTRAKRPRAAPVHGQEDHFAGLPAVPSTSHMAPSDIVISSFFALHRPLSLATPIPPIATAAAFDSIFQPRSHNDPWENGNSAERRPEDVIYALQNTVDSLESESRVPQDDSMRWEIIQESPSNQDGIKHLDGLPRQKNFDELVAQFKPFQAPPPPQAFVEVQKAFEKKKKKTSKEFNQRVAKALSRQKSYSTTIIVTESTSEDGQRTYTASSTPIVQVPGTDTNAAVGELHSPSTRRKSRFVDRMRQRQQALLLQQPAEILEKSDVAGFARRPPFARKSKMLLISVKRQRKLKMKKHKYKKLMKRTRNLRRRQDRA